MDVEDIQLDAPTYTATACCPLTNFTEFGMGESVPGLQSYWTLTSVTAVIPDLWLDSSEKRSRSRIYMQILEMMKHKPMTPFEIAYTPA